MTFEDFLEKMRQYEAQQKAWVINPNRKREVEETYRGIKKLVLEQDPNATVSCTMKEINNGTVYVNINTYWLTIRETKEFAELIKKANNFEIYPRTDETIQLNIAFHGVYKML